MATLLVPKTGEQTLTLTYSVPDTFPTINSRIAYGSNAIMYQRVSAPNPCIFFNSVPAVDNAYAFYITGKDDFMYWVGYTGNIPVNLFGAHAIYGNNTIWLMEIYSNPGAYTVGFYNKGAVLPNAGNIGGNVVIQGTGAFPEFPAYSLTIFNGGIFIGSNPVMLSYHASNVPTSCICAGVRWNGVSTEQLRFYEFGDRKVNPTSAIIYDAGRVKFLGQDETTLELVFIDSIPVDVNDPANFNWFDIILDSDPGPHFIFTNFASDTHFYLPYFVNSSLEPIIPYVLKIAKDMSGYEKIIFEIGDAQTQAVIDAFLAAPVLSVFLTFGIDSENRIYMTTTDTAFDLFFATASAIIPPVENTDRTTRNATPYILPCFVNCVPLIK